MKKIFVRNRGFGDNIWTEPIVRHFLDQGEEVLILTSNECIFDNYPTSRLFINDHEKIFPMLEEPISLKFQEKPKMHYLEAFREQAGIPDLTLSKPRLYLSEAERERTIKKRYAILHLDGYKDFRVFRNVYGVEWNKVVEYIRSLGIEPLQISGDGEDLVTTQHNTKNFREVMSVISCAEFFIGLDSGPSHIAAAMSIPSVIFFGLVNPLFRHLDSDKKVFLQSPCPFAHCYHEIPNSFGQLCRLVKVGDPPPCCIHDTDRVIEAIDAIESFQEPMLYKRERERLR